MIKRFRSATNISAIAVGLCLSSALGLFGAHASGAFEVPVIVQDLWRRNSRIPELPLTDSKDDDGRIDADQYFAGDGSAFTASKWGPSGGPYTVAFTSGNVANFTVANGTAAGAGGITVAGINAQESLTYSSPSGTLSTGGTVAPVFVASGKVVDFSSLSISTTAGTGFIKSGDGAFATAGNTYSGGFTLNAGTIIARGVNAMGANGALTVNGGTIAANSTRDFSGKFTGGITFGGDFQLGSSVSPAATGSNLTFNNTVSLGNATRTITIGGDGAYTFAGAIGGGSGAGLTVTNQAGAVGSVILTGPNTYTGNTTANGGDLALSGTASVANSAMIVIGPGGKLSINGLTSGLTLASGQGLRFTGTSTTGNINVSSAGSLTAAANSPIEFTAFNGATPPLTITGATGGINLQSTNPVTVNTTTQLSAGSYKLVAKSSGTVTGTPASVTIGGSGICSGCTASLGLVSGELFLNVVVSAPTTQASGITFSSVASNAITANWTNGNGSKRIVKMNTSNSFTAPTNGTDPTASSAYGGSGEQVVFNGTGNSVSVTGLSASTTYWFRVYEANGSGSTVVFNTATATNNPNSQATTTPPSLGTYSAASTNLGQNSTVTPSATPSNATSATATTTSNFYGKLLVNPTTGVVRVTNAYPAGVYPVTVKAFGPGGTTTRTFNLTVTTPAACAGTASFTAAANQPDEGSGIQNVAVGDFNNDGIQDLIYPVLGSPTSALKVRLGVGNGTFTAGGSATLGELAYGIATGDFNGDGNLDFATANEFPNGAGTVSYAMGNGSGGFGAVTTTTVGLANNGPKDVRAADMNNDGRTDIVFVTAALPGSSRIGVMLGNGDGTFAAPSYTTITGSYTYGMAVGDLNGDNNVDVATANYDSANFTVALGNGTGGFTSQSNLTAGLFPTFVSLGDIDGGNGPDLVGSVSGADSTFPFANNNAGTFSPLTTISTPAAQSVVIGDFNRDGKADLAVQESGASFRTSIWIGNGAGAFTSGGTVALSSSPTGSALGDFNGDGYQDISIANGSAGVGFVSVRLGGCVIAPPTITTSVSSLTNFGSVAVGHPSQAQSYTVSGSALTQDITVTAPTHFQVSLSPNTGFGSSVTLTQSGGTVASTTVYTRFLPTAAASFGANIFHASTGATTQNVSVAGTGFNGVDYAAVQFPKDINPVTSGNVTTVYGRVYEPGVTDSPGSTGQITAQLGYGAAGTAPSGGTWQWVSAPYNLGYAPVGPAENEDEHQGNLLAPAPGSYSYGFRFSLDGGTNWVYGGRDGVVESYATTGFSSMTVVAGAPSVQTQLPTNITSTGATLNGDASPQGAATTGYFRYSSTNPGTCNDTFGTRAPASGGTALGSTGSSLTFSQNIAGLTAGTTYYYCAIAQNSAGTGFGALRSFVTVPATQASNITFSSVTSNSMTINWTNGSGSKRIVKINTSNSFTPPVNGTDPTANATYGSGEQVVFNGTGNSVAVSGLSANTAYWFRVYEANGTGSGVVFNTATAANNPNNQTTSPIGPSTYTWSPAVGQTDWAVAANWSPARLLPNAGDTLVINGIITPAPTITNVGGVAGETIARLEIGNNASPILSASTSAKTLTIAGSLAGADLDIGPDSTVRLTGSVPLTIKVGPGNTGVVGGLLIIDGMHRLIGSDQQSVTFPSGGAATMASPSSDGYPFGDGTAGNGADGSVVFESGSTYTHADGESPFGLASDTTPVAVFQTGSFAQWLTNTGFQASGRTYANLQIGGVATPVQVSDSGTGNFQFDNLEVISTNTQTSSLTFTGSGASTVTIGGSIYSSGPGDGGTLPDVSLTAGTGGINITNVGPASFATAFNSRPILFGSDVNVSSTVTNLALNRNVIVGGLQQPNNAVMTINNTAGAAITGGSSGYVIGALRRLMSAPTTLYKFPVGDLNAYAPLDAFNVSAGANSSLTVGSYGTTLPNVPDPTKALKRFWRITEAGSVTAGLTFNYADGDIPGTANENNFQIFKWDGTTLSQPGGTVFPANNNASISGVTDFSDWTLAEPFNPGTLQYSATNYPTGESGLVTITITRTGGSDGVVGVSSATSGGTATMGALCNPGVDFTNAFAAANWPDGDTTSRTFVVPICADGNVEADETINLTLLNPTGGATLGTPNTATITIDDDDAAPSPTPTPTPSPCTPQPSGLVAQYLAEGDANDSAGPTFENGTLDSGATFASGYDGQAFLLDGVNDSVDLGSWHNYTDFGVSMWVKPGATQTAFANLIDNNHASGVNWVVQQNGSNTNEYGFGSVLFTLQADTWQHVAFTYTDDGGGVWKVYVNGVDVGTGTGTFTLSQPFLRLGEWGNRIGIGGGNRNWNGQMDEVAFFDRPLTAGEAQAIYQAGTSGFCPVVPELSINDVTLNEGNSGTTSFTFNVALTANPSGVTFDIATEDGTAKDGNIGTEDTDYVANSITNVSIPAGTLSYAFTVLVNGDTALESNETFFVNVTNVTGATVTDGQGLGTINSDDVNTTPPDTTITAGPPNPTNSTSASFMFTSTVPNGSGLSYYQCSLDNVAFTTCSPPATYTNLSQGAHNFQVRTVDNSGGVDPTPASYDWVVDTAAPPAPVVTAPLNGSASANQTPTITGTAEPNSVVSVYVDGSLLGTVTADVSGNWSRAVLTPLADGTHTVYAKATDAAGNTGPNSGTNTFKVDITGPETTIDTKPTNPTNNSTATFTYHGDDGGGSGILGYQCKLDGGAYTGCTVPQPQIYSGLAEGSHTFFVRALDQAGNFDSTPASHTFVVDTTAPGTTITANPTAVSNSSNATFQFTGSDPGGSGVAGFECSIDLGSFGGCTSPRTYTGLSDGSHTFKVRAKDAAGNVDDTPAEFVWTVDTTVPAAPVVVTPANGSFTNNPLPTVSGTAEANATVTIFIDGSSVGSTVADGSGNFAFTPPTPLAEGSHTVRARAADQAGNTSVDSNTNTFTVDLTPPTPPFVFTPASGSVTNDNTPTFTGAGEPGSPVSIIVDGTSIGTATPDASANWSFTPVATLADGPHSVRAQATDAAGNTSAISNTNTFTVDTTPPAAPVVATPVNNSATNNPLPPYTGTAEANSTVTVIVDGSAIGTTTASAGGNWSFTPTVPLANGSHTVRATATDPAGNVSPSSNTNTFIVDTAEPNTSIDSSPAAFSNSATATFTLSGNDGSGSGIARFECSLDNAVFATCTSPQTYSNLSSGSHNFRVRAVDAAGNTDTTPASYTWVIDTAPPDTTITARPPSTTSSTTATFTFTGADEPGGSGIASFECKLDAGLPGTCTSPQTYAGLAEGSHTFTVRAIDRAGNADPTPDTYTWTVDTTPPAAPVVTAPANASVTNDNTPTYTGTAEPNSTVTVIVDGTSAGTATANGSGAWSLTPVTSLADGPHTVKARATDAAGNTSADSSTNNFTVDTTPPAAPVVTTPANGSLTNSNTPTVSGTAEPGSTVTIFIDNTAAGTTTASAGGAFTLAVSTPLADGQHTVKARATDAAGNTGVDSNTNTFRVDTIPPTVVSIDDGDADDFVSVGAMLTYTITFNEDIDAASVSGADFNNAGTSAITIGAINEPSNGVFTVQVTATTAGTVILRIPVGAVIKDNAGNNLAVPVSDDTTVVVNRPPTINPAAAISRQKGSPASSATVATVADPDEPASGLSVSATTVPAGITVTNVNNSNGTVTANIAADCSATVGAKTIVFTVTDSNGATATANFTVNVTANAAPTLTYANSSVTLGSGGAIAPATGPSDNGSVSNIVLQSAGGFPGTLTVNPTTGAVTVPSTTQAGSYTVIVRATDNCGEVTDATLQLTVAKANTSVAVTSDNPDPSVVGQPVVVNFALNPSTAAASPTGSVVITVSGGAETCSGTIAANGTGSCTLTLLAPGARTISATYTGDANFNGSTGTASHNVGQAGTTISITNTAQLAAAPTSVGQSYTVSFAVSAVAPGAGTPTGTVTVSDGTGATCTGSVAADGTGSCQLTSTTPGVKTITASYGGDANFVASGSSGASHQVVISVAGNVKQFVAFGPATNLAGVSVRLNANGIDVATATTDAGGNYSFGLLASNANLVLTASAPGKTFEPITRTYNNVANNIANADFLAYDASGPGGNPRELRVVNAAATAGQPVTVPVEMVSQGNETSVSFTLAFDPALLGVPTSAACGSGITGCTVATFNTSTPGRVGVTVTRAAALAAGVREVVRITFPTSANTATSAALNFADAPVARDVRNVAGDPVPALYQNGFVTFGGPNSGMGFEGDIVGADGGPGGGDGVRSNDVTVVRQFVLGLTSPDAATNQFQRADVAPTATGGDGRLDATDVTVVRLYALGTLPPTPATGPTTTTNTRPENETEGSERSARRVSLDSASASSDGIVTVPVLLNAQGDEASLSFTLEFDSSALSFAGAKLGKGAPTGSVISVNKSESSSGRLGILVDSTDVYRPGEQRVLELSFRLTDGANLGGGSKISSTLAPQSVSARDGSRLTAQFAAGGELVLSRPR